MTAQLWWDEQTKDPSCSLLLCILGCIIVVGLPIGVSIEIGIHAVKHQRIVESHCTITQSTQLFAPSCFYWPACSTCLDYFESEQFISTHDQCDNVTGIPISHNFSVTQRDCYTGACANTNPPQLEVCTQICGTKVTFAVAVRDIHKNYSNKQVAECGWNDANCSKTLNATFSQGSQLPCWYTIPGPQNNTDNIVNNLLPPVFLPALSTLGGPPYPPLGGMIALCVVLAIYVIVLVTVIYSYCDCRGKRVSPWHSQISV